MGRGEGKIASSRFRSNLAFVRRVISFCWLVMSCCCNGYFAGIFAERRNMTVILTFDPQFTERTVQITHIVFPQMFPQRSHYGSTTLQANKKRNHSPDERLSSLNTKPEPAVNFDCKKCLKLLRFLEKKHCTVPRTIARICQTKSASSYFSFTSSHDTLRDSIHPRIPSSHPTKHVNSDWIRVWVNNCIY